MFGWWTERRKQKQTGDALFDLAAEASRAPGLYTEGGVADTIDGRFEMLCLHMVVLLDRVQRLPDDGAVLARSANEAFVTAMDDTMRHIGIGDLAVPRKVKKAAAALYDRRAQLGPILDTASDEAATQINLENALATLNQQPGLAKMQPPVIAAHMLRFAAAMAARTDADLRRGNNAA